METFSLRSLSLASSEFFLLIFIHLASWFVQHLYESFEEKPGYFQFATNLTSNDLEEIQKFLEAAVETW